MRERVRDLVYGLCVSAVVAAGLPGCGRSARGVNPSAPSWSVPPTPAATIWPERDNEPITPNSWLHAELPKLNLQTTQDPQGPAHIGEAPTIRVLAYLVETRTIYPHYKVELALTYGRESAAVCVLEYHRAENRLDFLRGNIERAEQYHYAGVTPDKIRKLNQQPLPVVDDLVRLGCRRQ